MSPEIKIRQRTLTLLAIFLAMFLGALDQTIVAAAMPRIVADLHGINRFAWIATAYLTASTALIPIYGKLADVYSKRAIEIFAVSLFLLGSILCGFAGKIPLPGALGDGMTQLIIARAIQGLGGAGLFALAFIIIADLFPPAERGRYQGYTGAVFAAASVLGPTLGGLLTDHGNGLIPGIEGWRLVFFVNIPFGALALWFIIKFMPQLTRPQTKRPDWISGGFLIVGLSLFVLTLQSFRTGAGSPHLLWLISITLIALVIFMVRSLRHPQPILNFSLFKGPVFGPAVAAIFLLGGAFIGIVIFEPLYIVNVMKLSATDAGMSLIPLSLGVVTTSILSGRMVSRFGHYKLWMLTGIVLLLCGLLLLTNMSERTSYHALMIYLGICGLGIGPSMPLYTLAVQNATPVQFIGQATAICQFFRQIGGVIAASILGLVLNLSINHLNSVRANPADQNYAALRVHLFAIGTGRIFETLIFMVAAGLVATLFVPELPLRKRHG